MKNLNKIKKYMDYLGVTNINCNVAFCNHLTIQDSRPYFSAEVIFDEDRINYYGWEEHPHNGSEMCKINLEYKISTHIDSILQSLKSQALEKARKDYLKMLKEEEDKKVERFLNNKIFGNSVDFIVEE